MKTKNLKVRITTDIPVNKHNLRIRITKNIPVDEHNRPKLDRCYNVIQETTLNNLPAYTIKINGVETTIYKFECKEIDENGNDII